MRPLAALVALLPLLSLAQPAPDVPGAERARMFDEHLRWTSRLRGGFIQPRWTGEGDRFWFSEDTAEGRALWLVDPEAGTQVPFFDVPRLRERLTAALGAEPKEKGVPFPSFLTAPGGKAVRLRVENRDFLLDLGSYALTPAKPLPPPWERVASPDGSRFATLISGKDIAVVTLDGTSRTLTTDGKKDLEWSVGPGAWSPEGRRLLASRTDSRGVYHMPIIDYSRADGAVELVPYTKSGTPIPQAELYVLDAASGRRVKVKSGAGKDDYLWPLGWRPDGREVFFARMHRTGKRVDVLAADAASGASRVLVTESRPESFVAGLDFVVFPQVRGFTPLKDGFLWCSERDGWRHVYHYGLDGKLRRQLTRGAFPVEEVVAVDEAKGHVFVKARAEKHPYHSHLYRVGLDGEGFTRLTEAEGVHRPQVSPSGRFFVDTHSKLDRPWTSELRTTEGQRVKVLSETDTSGLAALKWRPPEGFVVKAADGQTDLYGTLYLPHDFDPKKKYPVIDYIYAGPWLAVAQHGFFDLGAREDEPTALAQLGFAVFVVDGRGTPGRSKAFQDVTYGQVGLHEIADHVAVLNNLARTRPYLDTGRVGIYGASWGGYFAARAMFTAPEVFRVGVSVVPGDLTEEAVINEPYMGLPSENTQGYAFGSILHRAEDLKGRLVLLHGTSDVNAPISTTLRVVARLVELGKPHELYILPGQGHSFQGPSRDFLRQVMRRAFTEELRP
ncbi:MAG TPA: DPP IV N-terminal domain-containing protein [Myxococcus sp.]|nr:DPP IV N-terminal domain-containing protein [Myxococcus sp.]